LCRRYPRAEGQVVSEAWLWEPTLLLRWRLTTPMPFGALVTVDQHAPGMTVAEILRVNGRTIVLEQLWRGRKVAGQDVIMPLVPETREEWHAVPVVDEP
jgi:hypothetical protein